jgi:hypothetical protein
MEQAEKILLKFAATLKLNCQWPVTKGRTLVSRRFLGLFLASLLDRSPNRL